MSHNPDSPQITVPPTANAIHLLRTAQQHHVSLSAMAMDMYHLSGVLYRKKYRFLGYSYRLFLTGLILAFITGLFTSWR